jgi:hypothetical protein
MTQTTEWKKTQPGSTEAVQFSDGMLVTAEDLTAAMRYPLSVIQVLLKAYFGCGIVCGLDLKNPAEAETTGAVTAAGGAADPHKPPPSDGDRNFVLTVEKGVALGCDGYPIEICGPLKLDLTPDPCRHDKLAKTMLIAARRVTAAEAAARPCGCSSTGGEPAQQCTRMRDHALVQAFYEDQPPAELCQIPAPPPAKKGPDGKPLPPVAEDRAKGFAGVCACMARCDECACCGEPWVLLGSVEVSDGGLGKIDRSRRRLVKPIACICAATGPTETRSVPQAKAKVDETTATKKTPEQAAAEETTATTKQ